MIWIDSRGKGESELAEMLKSKFHLEVTVQHLDSADICIGEIGIERKTVGDLVFSTIGGDRHIWNQIEVLKNTYKHPVFIIEGYLNKKDRLIMGVLYSIAIGWSIPFYNTYNLQETAEVIDQIYTKYGTSKTSNLPPAAVIRSKSPQEIQWCMLQCVKGIGPKTATQIMHDIPNAIGSGYMYHNLDMKLRKIKRLRPETRKLLLDTLAGDV